MIRAKFYCTSIETDEFGNEHTRFSAVSDTNDTNKSWSEATPAGDLYLMISNPAAKGRFVQGREYYMGVGWPYDVHAQYESLRFMSGCAHELLDSLGVQTYTHGSLRDMLCNRIRALARMRGIVSDETKEVVSS